MPTLADVTHDPALDVQALAPLFGADPAMMRRFDIDSLNALKFSYPRTKPQGGVIERDMHSGQQFVPLLSVSLVGANQRQLGVPA